MVSDEQRRTEEKAHIGFSDAAISPSLHRSHARVCMCVCKDDDDGFFFARRRIFLICRNEFKGHAGNSSNTCFINNGIDLRGRVDWHVMQGMDLMHGKVIHTQHSRLLMTWL
jgi:hypothetical protein